MFLLMIGTVFGQRQSIFFDYDLSSFKGGYPLPSGENFEITGTITDEIGLVEVSIYHDISARKGYVTSANWRRGLQSKGANFTIPVQYKLRPSSTYDFTLSYYRVATAPEIDYLHNQLSNHLQAYFRNILKGDNSKLSLATSNNAIFKDLEKILTDGLEDFRDLEGNRFAGLSDLIFLELETADATKVSKKKRKEEGENAVVEAKSGQVDDLINIVMNEVSQFTNKQLMMLVDKRTVENYDTEKALNTIALNVGYGGVWFEGGGKDFQYDHAPYIGLSFPFGKKDFSKPFWNNLSLTTGVYLLNMEDGDGNKVSGPIIQRPIYLGVGYKFFKFLKLQAGATLLETQVDDGNFVNFDQISVRPTIGLGIEFNFWMGFDKK